MVCLKSHSQEVAESQFGSLPGDAEGKVEPRLRDQSVSYWETAKSRLWVLLPPGSPSSPAHL